MSLTSHLVNIGMRTLINCGLIFISSPESTNYTLSLLLLAQLIDLLQHLNIRSNALSPGLRLRWSYLGVLCLALLQVRGVEASSGTTAQANGLDAAIATGLAVGELISSMTNMRRTQPERQARSRRNLTKTQRASMETRLCGGEEDEEEELEDAEEEVQQEGEGKKRKEASKKKPEKKEKKKKSIHRTKKTGVKEKNLKTNELVIITQNVRGGGENKLDRISEYLAEVDPDIFVITETKAWLDRLMAKDKLRSMIPQYRTFANGFTEKEGQDLYVQKKVKKISNEKISEREKNKKILQINPKEAKGKGGVWILVNERICRFLNGEPIFDVSKRAIRIRFNFPKRKIELIGVYAPAEEGEERQNFFEEIIDSERNAYEKIMIGDWNTYENAKRDSWCEKQQNKRKDHRQFTEMMKTWNLADAYLHENMRKEASEGWTYFQEKKEKVTYAARIDAALLTSTLVDSIASCAPLEFNEIVDVPDHKPLKLSLKAEVLGLKKFAQPTLPAQKITKIDVSDLTDEKRSNYMKALEKRIGESVLLQNIQLDDEQNMQLAYNEITTFMREEGYKHFGTKETTLNEALTWKNDKAIRLGKILKKVNRAAAAAYTRKDLVETKAWRSLTKVREIYQPKVEVGNPLSDNQKNDLRKELKRIQNKLVKEKKEAEREYNEKRIAEYLEELEHLEEDNPRNFFKRANIDKNSVSKQQTAVTINENGEERISTKPKEVMIETFKYWQAMFRARETEARVEEPWFETAAHKAVSEKIKALSKDIMKEITEEEVTRTLRTFKKRKAPGPNEVPIECLQNSSKNSTEWLTKIFNFVSKNAKSPLDWKDGVMYTLYKGGDETLCSNRRPVVLLNSSYKLFMKILTKRTSDLLEKHNLISSTQGGWRRGRAAQQKIHLLVSAIEHSIEAKKPIFLAYVDYSKAFDTTNHDYLLKILDKSGFHNDFIALLKEILSNNNCQVITPYGLTEKFDWGRGVRQGCVMSPLLFTLYIEPLLRWIDESEGFEISKNGKKSRLNMLAFADDMSVIGKSFQNLEEKWEKMREYSKATNLVISNDGKNKEKTVLTHNEVDANGTLKKHNLYTDDEKKKPIPTLKPSESYKYLGVMVNLAGDWSLQEDICMKKLIRQSNYIRHRAFSDKQCVTIINKVFVPSILYRASVAKFRRETLRRWDALLSNVILLKCGVAPNSGRNYLFEGESENGYGLISLEAMCNAAFIVSKIENGLLAKDDDARVISRMNFQSVKQEAEEISNRINIARNDVTTQEEALAIERWFPQNWWSIFKKKRIRSINELQKEGRIDTAKILREGLPLSVIIQNLTAHDSSTLRPEILMIMNLEDVKPVKEFKKSEKGFLEAFTDGSWNSTSKRGAYAVTFEGDKENEGEVLGFVNAYASFEMELRPMLHVLVAVPWENDLIIYTDSLSSITAIIRQWDDYEKKDLCLRERNLLERIVRYLKKRKSIGARTELRFVYSHLRDEESEEHEPDPYKKGRSKEEKEEIMSKQYGEDKERILAGNKRADELMKKNGHMVLASPYSQLDPEFILQIDNEDAHSKLRLACYNRLLQEELLKNRKAHPNTYDWLNESQIEKVASQVLMCDKSRKLSKIRNFMWKLRNYRIKTMSKMHERWKGNKKKSFYSEHVLSKYEKNSCPRCNDTEEDVDHFLDCIVAETEREKIQKEILQLLKAESLSDPTNAEENSPTIQELIEEWFIDDEEDGWKRKWAYMGYVKKSVIRRLEKIEWQKESSSLVIIKKIQVIIIDIIRETWIDRCRILHKSETLEDEKRKQMKQRRENLTKEIKEVPVVNTAKEQENRRSLVIEPSPAGPAQAKAVEENAREKSRASSSKQRTPRTRARPAFRAVYDDDEPTERPDSPDDDENQLLQPLWQEKRPRRDAASATPTDPPPREPSSPQPREDPLQNVSSDPAGREECLSSRTDAVRSEAAALIMTLQQHQQFVGGAGSEDTTPALLETRKRLWDPRSEQGRETTSRRLTAGVSTAPVATATSTTATMEALRIAAHKRKGPPPDDTSGGGGPSSRPRTSGT